MPFSDRLRQAGVLVFALSGGLWVPGVSEAANVTGTEGDDVIDANYITPDGTPNGTTDGPDNVNGLAGNDTIDSMGGDDNTSGHAGDDTINAGPGDDVLNGNEGNDTLNGGEGDDRIEGGDGDDTLSGGPGADALNGHDGIDTIDGGDGNDVIHGHAGNDVVNGRAGEDDIKGGDGDDVLAGGEQNDTINGDSGADEIHGGGGHDTLAGGYGNDTINGDGGDDTVDGGIGEDIIDGGGGNDTLTNGQGGGVIHGGDGNDVIELYGSWGPHHHGYAKWNEPEFDFQKIVAEGYGDNGGDYVKGRFGGWHSTHSHFYYLHGGTGKDVVEGGGGQDLVIVQGNDGDTVITGPGDDYIAILGNSADNITFYDAIHYNADGTTPTDENGNPVDSNNGTDMLCFVRDVNPQQLTMFSTQVGGSGNLRHFMEFNEGLATNDAVTLDKNQHPGLKYIEAVRTGTGNDTITGTDYGAPGTPAAGAYSYNLRWRPIQKPWDPGYQPVNNQWLRVHELFFLGAGNDTVTTGRGNDLIDAAAGDDTIHLGPDHCFVITGPGNDTVHLDAASDNPPSSTDDGLRTRIADLGEGDKIVVSGTTAAQVTLENQQFGEGKGGAYAGTIFTSVMLDATERFVVLGHSRDKLEVKDGPSGVTVTLKKGTGPVAVDPPKPWDEAPNKEDVKGPGKTKAPEGNNVKPRGR